MTDHEPETWRTDPRERLLTSIDRTWARGVLGTTPEQLLDDYAHQLAVKIRAAYSGEGPDEDNWITTPYDAADLIDPEAQR